MMEDSELFSASAIAEIRFVDNSVRFSSEKSAPGPVMMICHASFGAVAGVGAGVGDPVGLANMFVCCYVEKRCASR